MTEKSLPGRLKFSFVFTLANNGIDALLRVLLNPDYSSKIKRNCLLKDINCSTENSTLQNAVWGLVYDLYPMRK